MGCAVLLRAPVLSHAPVLLHASVGWEARQKEPYGSPEGAGSHHIEPYTGPYSTMLLSEDEERRRGDHEDRRAQGEEADSEDEAEFQRHLAQFTSRVVRRRRVLQMRRGLYWLRGCAASQAYRVRRMRTAVSSLCRGVFLGWHQRASLAKAQGEI